MDIRTPPPSRIVLRIFGPTFLLLCIFVFLVSSVHAAAQLILDAEVRVTAEDNVVGLLTGEDGSSGSGNGSNGSGPASAGIGGGPGGQGESGGSNDTGSGSRSPSDLSLTVTTELGASLDAGRVLSFFAKGVAERTDYQTYSEYDQSTAGVIAGMTLFGERGTSLNLYGFDRIKRFDNDPDRDCAIYGSAASLKQRPFRRLWLRETATYETSRAADRELSYRGTIFRVAAGYDLTDHLLAGVGYRFQSRRYKDAAATALRTGAASIGIDYRITHRWSAGASYDRETTAAGTADVITRNNISSLSLRFTY